MGETEKYAKTIERREGWLCLDFANTAEWHTSEQPTEELRSYADLVAWAQAKGVLTEDEAAQLQRKAGSCPTEAADVLQRAITLREAIFRIFSTVTEGGTPSPADLAILNGALTEGMCHFQIVVGLEGYAWDWSNGELRLDAMLWPVVRSAANLLTSDDLARVGMCADDRGCGWLFLDTSRNRSRRWCSMEGCGNRAKAKLHYKRQQTEG
jgi:predicted RNA-binding Zn ribbon-like protein